MTNYETVRAGLDLRMCHTCHGAGTAHVKFGQIFATDSDDEAALAYRTMACPECLTKRADALAALEGMRRDGERLSTILQCAADVGISVVEPVDWANIFQMSDPAITAVSPTYCKNCGHVDLQVVVERAPTAVRR